VEGGEIQKLIKPSQTKSIQVHPKNKTNGTSEYPLDPTQFQGISQVMQMPILVNQLVTVVPNDTKSKQKVFW
jgi:hypothetical protein